MGACEVCTVRSGESARKVFNIICDEDEREYGCDSYNGSFSTCSLTRVHNLFDKYKKGNERKAFEFLEKRDIDKRDVEAVDLGVKGYLVRKCKFVKSKNDLKLRYFVKDTEGVERFGKSFSTMDKAKEYALEKALRTGNMYEVSKRYIDDRSGSQDLGNAVIEEKEYRSRPKRIPKGATVTEIHMYAFYGWAAC